MRIALLTSTLLFLTCAWSSAGSSSRKDLTHTSELDYHATIKAAPFILLIEQFLQSSFEKSAPSIDVDGLSTAAGIKAIDTIQHSNMQLGDTWLSSIQLNTRRPAPGLFKLLGTADPHLIEPFYAPASTDIALQVALELNHLPQLLTDLAASSNQQVASKNWLEQKIGARSLRELLHGNKARLHLAVDFDDKNLLNLGRVEIGRPHILLRIDGVNPLIEQLIQHYVHTRNLPLIRTEENGKIVYRLPKYLILASAGYLPVITIDPSSNTTSIASSQAVLDRVRNSTTSLDDDPHFLQTWQGMPDKGAVQFYLSKRLLNSTEEMYQKSLKEDWTDNPQFLAHQPLISQCIRTLNSSESGIAFSHTSKEKQQNMKLKAPLPSLLILLAIALQQ